MTMYNAKSRQPMDGGTKKVEVPISHSHMISVELVRIVRYVVTHGVIDAFKNEGFSIREIAKGGYASKSKVGVVS